MHTALAAAVALALAIAPNLIEAVGLHHFGQWGLDVAPIDVRLSASLSHDQTDQTYRGSAAGGRV